LYNGRIPVSRGCRKDFFGNGFPHSRFAHVDITNETYESLREKECSLCKQMDEEMEGEMDTQKLDVLQRLLLDAHAAVIKAIARELGLEKLGV